LISAKAHRRFWRWAFSLKCAALRAIPARFNLLHTLPGFLSGVVAKAFPYGSSCGSHDRFWLNTGTCSATIQPTSKRQRQKFVLAAREAARRVPVDRFTSDTPRAASTNFSSEGGKDYTHVLNRGGRGVRSPLDGIRDLLAAQGPEQNRDVMQTDGPA